MAFWDRLAYKKLGRPAPGQIVTHPLNSFRFEEGADLIGRLEKSFGDLTRLSCMDLGCGPSDTVIGRQVLEIPWRRLTSVEPFMPYVYKLRQKTAKAHHHDIREVQIESIFNLFLAREADLILMIDVLEHFTRRAALDLLVKLEKFASKGVVLFVPIGDVPQEALDENVFQRHRSTWQPQELARLGYDMEVYEGFHGHLTPPATAAWAIKRVK